MAESAFTGLCRQARTAGSRKLTFEAMLEDFPVRDNEGTDTSWRCTADMRDGSSVCGFGRTGEESLRRVVESLTRKVK